MPFLLLILFLGVHLWASPDSVSGTVVSSSNAPIQNASVQLKSGSDLHALARVLTDAQGVFHLEAEEAGVLNPKMHFKRELPFSFYAANSQSVRVFAVNTRGELQKEVFLQAMGGHNTLKSPKALLSEAAFGVYFVFASVDSKQIFLGSVHHQSHATASKAYLTATSAKKQSLALTASDLAQFLVVKKEGYLPESLALSSLMAGNVGEIVLKKDPLETRIDSVMASMSLDDKIGQMMQGLAPATSTGTFAFGSALQGGGLYLSDFANSAWSKKIPMTYGKDNVHGMGDVKGATIFPHNIGLGATRDSALVRRIGEAIAKEMWAANIDLNFSPAISVPRDERWGRVYEGYGESPELVSEMGAAMVRGLQGDHFDASHRVIATAKHFLGDGATNLGYDRGNATISDEELRKIHLPPYEAVVEQGVLSIMASFNQINGVHQHVDSLRLTGWLKTELAFDGYVIADWEGIENSKRPGEAGNYSGSSSGTSSSSDAIKKAINAGIDMAMVPDTYSSFGSTLKSLVSSNQVSEARVNDAVRRILRAKFRAGRMDNPSGPSEYRSKTNVIGSAAHRELAREAVRKSMVLMQNESQALPLSQNAKIFVTVNFASNIGYQCGGWTAGWQGVSGDADFPGGTNILNGMKQVASGASFVSSANDADIVVYVIGEKPYAEWYGDYRSANFDGMLFQSFDWNNGPEFKSLESLGYLSTIDSFKSSNKKVVTVFITGRPLPVSPLIEKSDAFVVAWLPGTEGAGVADVLFGDYAPTGKLSHQWPSASSQIPINQGDGQKPLFEYDFGLTY